MKTQVVVLFTTAADLDAAVDALTKRAAGTINTQAIEGLPQSGPDSLDASVPGLAEDAGWPNHAAPRYTETNLLGEFGLNDEEISFFSQGLEVGGTVLVVEAEDTDETALRQILGEYNAQFFSG
jgi:hypothetical protein